MLTFAFAQSRVGIIASIVSSAEFYVSNCESDLSINESCVSIVQLDLSIVELASSTTESTVSLDDITLDVLLNYVNIVTSHKNCCVQSMRYPVRNEYC